MMLWVGAMAGGTTLDKKPLCYCPACNPVPLTADKFITGPHTGRQLKESSSVVKCVTAEQLMEHYYFIGKQSLWVLHFSSFSKCMNCSSIGRRIDTKKKKRTKRLSGLCIGVRGIPRAHHFLLSTLN